MTRAEQHLVLSFSGGKPKEWAKVVAESLHLDTETCRDETWNMTAPDGKPWNLRVQITDRAPELLRSRRACRSPDDETAQLLAAPRADRAAGRQRHGHRAGEVRQVPARILSGPIPAVSKAAAAR